nr:MAG TPA: hypothetical protein [Caudoviricetes sp.]
MFQSKGLHLSDNETIVYLVILLHSRYHNFQHPQSPFLSLANCHRRRSGRSILLLNLRNNAVEEISGSLRIGRQFHEQIAIGLCLSKLISQFLVLNEPAAIGRLLTIGTQDNILKQSNDLLTILSGGDPVDHLNQTAIHGQFHLSHLGLSQIEVKILGAGCTVIVGKSPCQFQHCDFSPFKNKRKRSPR